MSAASVTEELTELLERWFGRRWQAEWETLPEIVRLTAGALHHLTKVLPSLQVHPDRMWQNLELTNGLIFAEPVSMALAKRIGKMPAHQLLEAACKTALNENRHLKDVLRSDPLLANNLTPAEIDDLFDPQKYLGSAGVFIDAVLSKARRQLSAS